MYYNKYVMYTFICKLFIPNYQNTNDTEVREKYGSVFSIVSIVFNMLMVTFKLVVSFITNSVSIRADAFNNLSDVGSNLATLFGFKLSNKHPDADHPYGHGRMEYVSGMIVSFLILLMGFEAAKESFLKIIHPEEIVFSPIAIVVLVASIIIKLTMAYLNKSAGKAINSDALNAAGQDSLNDTLVTSATLVCLIIFKITGINLDAYLGFVASILVLKSGIEIFKDVLDTILGKAPDPALIKDIEKTIVAHDEILGIHDLMLHDYGPSQQFMSLHVEVPASIPVIEMHDVIDNIELEILNKYKILTTIHMDPIDTKNKQVNKLKTKVKALVLDINPEYSIHDFRIVAGPTHTNIVFDVLLPADDKSDIEVLRKKISDGVAEIDSKYRCVINFDHSYV